jgi:predicted acyltransferase
MSSPSPTSRIASLDQFRGYTVLGMFLVNFVGSYAAIKATLPVLSHHHTYCSYADTIMPQFFFAVGFAYRFTFLRRAEKSGSWSAYRHAIWRNLALLLVAFIVHSVGSRWESWSNEEQLRTVALRWAKQDLFQTLAHIAVTSIWVLPVIARRPSVRIIFAIGSGLLHLGLSYAFNYRWTNTPPNGVDGGPLGFLTWTIPLLAGTLAYDVWVANSNRLRIVVQLSIWGLAIMAFAYGLSCLHLAPSDIDEGRYDVSVSAVTPPFIQVAAKPPTNDLFTMSQRSGSLTYLTFGAGVSLLVYALFVLACDIGTMQIGILRTFGVNALAGYILHDLVNAAVKPFVPRDSPLWYVFIGFGVSLAICYLVLRSLERQRLYLKL